MGANFCLITLLHMPRNVAMPQMCPFNGFIAWTARRVLLDIVQYPTRQFRHCCFFFFARRPPLFAKYNHFDNYSRTIPAYLSRLSSANNQTPGLNSVDSQPLTAHTPWLENVVFVFPANSHNSSVAFRQNRFHNVLFFYAFLIRCRKTYFGLLYLICVT